MEFPWGWWKCSEPTQELRGEGLCLPTEVPELLCRWALPWQVHPSPASRAGALSRWDIWTWIEIPQPSRSLSQTLLTLFQLLHWVTVPNQIPWLLYLAFKNQNLPGKGCFSPPTNFLNKSGIKTCKERWLYSSDTALSLLILPFSHNLPHGFLIAIAMPHS